MAKRKKLIAVIIASALIVVLGTVLLACYFCGWFGGVYGAHRYNGAYYNIDAIRSEELSIHFLQSDNGYPGDCIYIKAGETDMLIDAGSRQTSAEAIALYVDRFCTDGVLEYVVVTHGDLDHIGGFVGTEGIKGIFDRYVCKTIIQFVLSTNESDLLNAYYAARDAEVANGAKCFTALECCKNARGAQKVWQLADDITLEILYQEYYETYTSNENDNSVCLLITQGDNHYLFTGDLEKAGEESLAEHNPDLPQVTLYKAGHHGSYTSSNEVLLDKIQPQIVCVCCVADNVLSGQPTQNSAPATSFLERVARYTDNVFATNVATLKVEKNGYKTQIGYEPLNGDIVFACTDGKIKMYFSENDIKLKDTTWFRQNRTMPSDWEQL